MKTGLLVIALGLFVCLVVLGSLAADPAAPSAPETPGGPWFEVQVVKPRLARPFAGVLPDGLFGLPPNVLHFGHASPGARIGSVARDRLELSADGWELVIETDGAGRVAAGTRVVFPIDLAERLWSLRCQPAAPATGYFLISTRGGADALDGEFLIELPACEDTETGEALEWPPAPLTLRGSFQALPLGGR